MPASKLLIGIVDDDTDVAIALSSLVRSLGYATECFNSAEQLLGRNRLDQMCCVISDIHMPSMDGIQLTRELAKLMTGLPVILMTGLADPALEDRAHASGSVAFVHKPFNLEELSRGIDKALAGIKTRED